MMTQSPSDDPAFREPGDDAVAEQRRAQAAEVMADLAGASEESLQSLPPELPVEAVVACGNCRLYGGVAPGIAFPDWLATAAARRLIALLDKATDDATRLPDIWGDCTGDEAEDLVAGLIHARMDTWAALLQLDDVLAHATDDRSRRDLGSAIDDVDEALERFDRALDARQDDLSSLAGTRLLRNLRAMLAPQHRDPLPWWLDGRLEAKANEIDAQIDELADRLLYEQAGSGRTRLAAVVPTLRDLHASVTQVYAAAAAAAGPPATRLSVRWRSPDGTFVATLVPPAAKQAVPSGIVLDFTDRSGRPAIALVGRRCMLAGTGSPIVARRIDGEDRAVADVPGAALFADVAATGDRPLTLVVDPGTVDWPLDVS